MAAVTRLGLYGGPRAPYAGFVAASASAVVSGTFTEAEVVAGTATFTITLSNTTWVANLADVINDIVAGLSSDGSEAFGFAAIYVNEGAGGSITVVRNSDTLATFTLSAEATFDIVALETITSTLPNNATATEAVLIATGDFTISPVASGAARYKGFIKNVGRMMNP